MILTTYNAGIRHEIKDGVFHFLVSPPFVTMTSGAMQKHTENDFVIPKKKVRKAELLW